MSLPLEVMARRLEIEDKTFHGIVAALVDDGFEVRISRHSKMDGKTRVFRVGILRGRKNNWGQAEKLDEALYLGLAHMLRVDYR